MEYLYESPDIPERVSFEERTKKAMRKFGMAVEGPDIALAKTEYFETHEDAETYWSLVELKKNICASIREKEGPGENQGYKVKRENGIGLAPLDAEIEKRRIALFKNDTEAKDAFTAGKRKSAREIGTFEENLGVLKRGGSGE